MIQRKQTLFLLAVAIIGIVSFFTPFQTMHSGMHEWKINLILTSNWIILNSNIYFPIVLNVLVIILSLFTIFLYKKRGLQYKLANLLVLLNIFILGIFFLMNFIKNDVQGEINFSIGAFLPIVSASLAFFAAFFIKKDEQLVRNSDRIR
jgi:hypothetical protein